jgi:hypothetical protein
VQHWWLVEHGDEWLGVISEEEVDPDHVLMLVTFPNARILDCTFLLYYACGYNAAGTFCIDRFCIEAAQLQTKPGADTLSLKSIVISSLQVVLECTAAGFICKLPRYFLGAFPQAFTTFRFSLLQPC